MNDATTVQKIAADILKSFRRKAGLSQNDVAKRFGRSRSFVSRVELGQRSLSEVELASYLAILQVPEQQFAKMQSNLLQLEKLDGEIRRETPTSPPTFTSSRPPLSDRSEIFATLATYFKGQPVNRVEVFGSVARNTFGQDSDVDLFLEYATGAKPSLYDLAGVKIELEELLGRKVDLVLSGSAYNFITAAIAKDKVIIYGQAQAA